MNNSSFTKSPIFGMIVATGIILGSQSIYDKFFPSSLPVEDSNLPGEDLSRAIAAVKTASPSMTRKPNKNYCDLGESGLFQMPDLKNSSVSCTREGLKGNFDINGKSTYAEISKKEDGVVVRIPDLENSAGR